MPQESFYSQERTSAWPSFDQPDTHTPSARTARTSPRSHVPRKLFPHTVFAVFYGSQLLQLYSFSLYCIEHFEYVSLCLLEDPTSGMCRECGCYLAVTPHEVDAVPPMPGLTTASVVYEIQI